MFTTKLTCFACLKSTFLYSQTRQIQATIIGATNDIGTNLALMMKQNPKINKLNVYDDDESVRGLALELCLLPGGPLVTAFAGPKNVGKAIIDSELIVLVTRTARRPGVPRDQMLVSNAPHVQMVCRAMADKNPHAFLAISTNPINAVIPYACALLSKFNIFNPFKVFGLTQIDVNRSRALAANIMGVSPSELNVPVIGGHSEDTILPLFSNLLPQEMSIDPNQIDFLTRLVKRAGSEVVVSKNGQGSATIGMAWSVNESVNALVDAICGENSNITCYTPNPHFGTRFFSGPNVVGNGGLSETCTYTTFEMSEYERTKLDECIMSINKDISQGEDYARIFG